MFFELATSFLYTFFQTGSLSLRIVSCDHNSMVCFWRQYRQPRKPRLNSSVLKMLASDRANGPGWGFDRTGKDIDQIAV